MLPSLLHRHYSIALAFMVTIIVGDNGFKGPSIYYVIRDGGGRRGFPDLLQYYIGGVLKVYYNITVLKGKWKVIILFHL